MGLFEKFWRKEDLAQREIEKANDGLFQPAQQYPSISARANSDSPPSAFDGWEQKWIESMQWLRQAQQSTDPYAEPLDREPKANGPLAGVRELHAGLGVPDWRGDARYWQIWEKSVSLVALKENLLKLGPDAAEAIADDPRLFLAGLAVRGLVQLGANWAKTKGIRQANGWPLAFDLALLGGSAATDIAGFQQAVDLAAAAESDSPEEAYQLNQAQRCYAKAVAAAVTTVPRIWLGKRDFWARKPPIDITPPRESGSAVPALVSGGGLANQLRELTQRSPQLTRLVDAGQMMRLLPELLRRWPEQMRQLFFWLSGAYGPWNFATEFGPFFTESHADDSEARLLGQHHGGSRESHALGNRAELVSTPEYTEVEIEEILDWAFDMAQIGKLPEVADAFGLPLNRLHELAQERGMRLLRSVSAVRQKEILDAYLESQGLPLVESRSEQDLTDLPTSGNSKRRKAPTEAEIRSAFYLADQYSDRRVAKQLFGKSKSTMDRWRRRLGMLKGKRVDDQPRAEELFSSEERQRIAHQGHEARTFGGLTRVADEHDASIATVYGFEQAAGLSYAHEPVDLQLKQAAIDDLGRGEHPDDVAQKYNLPASIVNRWSRGRYSDEEFLAMLIETIGGSGETVSEKHNVPFTTILHVAGRFRWPHPIRKWAQGKPEHEFTEAMRLQILNRVQAATRFGEISRIVLDEGATIPMVYRWAKVLGVPIVLPRVDPQEKQQIKSRLSPDVESTGNNNTTKRRAKLANYAKIASEVNLPVEILAIWDGGRSQQCDEEIWAILDQEGYRRDADIADRYEVDSTTPGRWRARFGLGPKIVELRSVESFSEDELRALLHKVNSGSFGALTTIADENGVDPLMMLHAAKALRIPIELKQVDPLKKKAIVEELHEFASATKGDPGYKKKKREKYTELATRSGYGVQVIRTWAEGEFTAEEGWQIARDHGHRTGPELARILDVPVKTAYALLRKYEGIVVPRVELGSAKSFTKQQLLDYLAEVNATPVFGALTTIADNNGFSPETLFRSAKTLGIPIDLKLTPIDPTKKQAIEAELRVHVDAISHNSRYQRLKEREDKCAELATKFGYDISVIRTWANGDYTADEIIPILTAGVGRSAASLGKERQISRWTIRGWRNRFGFTEN